MSKSKQLNKNVQLSGKLAEYIVSNPSATEGMPVGVSFVVFSSKDKELNKLNNKLVISLKNEGKDVVKATQENNKKQPWSFTLAI